MSEVAMKRKKAFRCCLPLIKI